VKLGPLGLWGEKVDAIQHWTERSAMLPPPSLLNEGILPAGRRTTRPRYRSRSRTAGRIAAEASVRVYSLLSLTDLIARASGVCRRRGRCSGRAGGEQSVPRSDGEPRSSARCYVSVSLSFSLTLYKAGGRMPGCPRCILGKFQRRRRAARDSHRLGTSLQHGSLLLDVRNQPLPT
jgi:hypothetical protein